MLVRSREENDHRDEQDQSIDLQISSRSTSDKHVGALR